MARTATEQLATYERMRDFAATPEPAGRTPVKPSSRPRFVVQKHAATRLHYDFRLEHEGVFLSWAVTRGPSLDPEDKRLAVETEAHPLDYGDFEGVIPKGQYGGGTVMLWDRGYWSQDPSYSVEAALKKGHLHVHLDGGRMKGAWHLIRLKADRNARGKAATRTNWLLFKAKDALADPAHPDALVENETSIASGRAMADIAAGRGAGPKPFMTRPEKKASAKAVWNSRPKDAPPPPPAAPMPGFVAPQLCKAVARPPSGEGWVHEIKLDGYRTQIHVKDGRSICWTRKGLDWTARFPEIAREAARLPDCVLDSEIVATDAEGRPDFSALQAALSEGKTAGLVAFCFDLLWAGGRDLRTLPLRDRKARLEDVLEHGAPEGASRLRYVDHFVADGAAVLQSVRDMGLEGVVSKRLDARYASGRSESWTKAKCRGGQEVVIGGWTGTATTLRSLLVGLYEGDQLSYAGRVGTGFTQASAGALARQLAAIAADRSPFSGLGAPRKTGDINWCRPELVAEIEQAGFSADGLVRQAAFKGLREDKPAAEVVREAAAAPPPPSPSSAGGQARSARGSLEGSSSVSPPAASRPPPQPSWGGKATATTFRGVGISNPDKALWPATDDEAEVTKADLAAYLDAVGDWMLQHYAGRPISVVRTPDGIEGEQRFFQRHAMSGQSKLLTLIEVGERKPYLGADTVEGLIAIAQSGGTELHPWNGVPGDVDTPGRLVFDLDPAEDVPFARVVAGAKEIRERLAAVGLVGFLKTTGGKGLHVTTPLAPARGGPDWKAAKAFAAKLCGQAAADSPDAYTINMAKKVRAGRIYLDYLRNDRMATAVGPLSPRARPGAPVSMPLDWDKATARLDPKRYTLRTVPGLLRKLKPWAEYDAAARPLAQAVGRLSDG